MRRLRHTLSALALVALVYLVCLALFPHEGLWIADNASRFLQMRAFMLTGNAACAIPWPGAEFDPAFEFQPLPPPFAVVRDGRLLSQYSPVFALVSAPFFRLFGYSGLYLLPLVSSLVMLAGLAAIAGQLGAPARAAPQAVLIAGLTTPVWFYSVVFWEHTLALCLLAWALWCGLRFIRTCRLSFALAGSILAAAGAYFRDEMYIVCVVLAAALVLPPCPRRWATLALSVCMMLVVLGPLFVFQRAVTGNPFGLHMGINVGPAPASAASFLAHLRLRPTVIYNLLLASHPSRALSLAVAGPAVALLIIRPAFKDSVFRVALPVVAFASLAASALSLGSLAGTAHPVTWLLRSGGLFAATPVIVLGCLSAAQVSGTELFCERWLWGIGLAFACCYVLAAPEISSVGIHWGGRYLLPLYPLLAVLAAANIARWMEIRGRGTQVMALVLLMCALAGVAGQVLSMNLLCRKASFSAALNREAAGRPERVVVTDLWWLPQELYGVFYDRMIFYAEGREQIEGVQARLEQSGVREYLLATQDPSATAEPGSVLVHDNGLNYFRTWLVPREADHER
ncbi:MAG: hypothetical protein JXB04_05220 [Kiritimatiellae bacterium]|nr:hypothetical protein [Kiritimatiellia bacterium]